MYLLAPSQILAVHIDDIHVHYVWNSNERDEVDCNIFVHVKVSYCPLPLNAYVLMHRLTLLPTTPLFLLRCPHDQAQDMPSTDMW